MELTPEQRKALEIVAAMKRDPLCPNCGRRPQNQRSKTGFCSKCDDDRERQLEAKRRWWHKNHGNERQEKAEGE